MQERTRTKSLIKITAIVRMAIGRTKMVEFQAGDNRKGTDISRCEFHFILCISESGAMHLLLYASDPGFMLPILCVS